MFQSSTNLAGDSRLITDRISEKGLDINKVLNALDDLRKREELKPILWGGLPEEGVNSVGELVLGIQGKLIGVMREDDTEVTAENLPMQMPLRDILDDGKTMTFIFQQTENGPEGHFIYDIKPDSTLMFREMKKVLVSPIFH